MKAGLSGPFLNAIKAMYLSVFSCVRVLNKVTEIFYCPFGVKQGCIFSPALFSLFVNEISIGMEAVGKLQPGLVELFLLLFADDLALLSSTAMGLQNQLNHLNSVCKEHSLSINIELFQVMVGFSAKMKSDFYRGVE